MKHFTAILLVLLFEACDCIQESTGVVLDRQTRAPLSGVCIGKFEKEDPANPYSRQVYSDTLGQYLYRAISGGLGKCPDLELYFSKSGYQTVKCTFSSGFRNDTILLEKVPE